MFQRKPLRDDIQKEVLARLADGRLAAGSRINETHLSKDMGISRTPLREAMITLAASGFMASDMGRGFKVPELSAEEFMHIQVLLANLEPMALNLAPRHAPDRIMQMQNLLGRIRLNTKQPQAVADLITTWAAMTVEHCPNPVLLADIARLENLSRRYWFAAVSQGFDATVLAESLARMYEMLRQGQPAEAAEHWHRHILDFSATAKNYLPKGHSTVPTED
jgi:DNA-binding GntR family transcriptional regulator